MSNISSNQSWWDSEMANELRSLFYQQYGQQKNLLNFLQGKMQAMIQHPTGFSPAALAALRANATDTTGMQFQNAQKALQQHEFSTGGQDLPSGVNSQLDAGLYAEQARQQAQGQNAITLADEQQKEANYWNAEQALGGVASARNPQSYLSGSLDASAGVGGLVDAATKSNQSGFGSQLEGGLAKALTGNSSAEQGLGAALAG